MEIVPKLLNSQLLCYNILYSEPLPRAVTPRIFSIIDIIDNDIHLRYWGALSYWLLTADSTSYFLCRHVSSWLLKLLRS